MSLGVRGFNPIWSEFDLTGNLFDDTYYMFVLQNTIPYLPAIVYHDPDLSVAWTNPIQFLANGTLPVDIYFESDVVYRLEFRQGDTQDYPLIYEVNNYVAGSGGSTPVDTVAFASSNQITNPQFALINFASPYTFSGTDPDPIVIGPGWVLELAGTGNVTIKQVPLNSSNTNPSNAPYALQLTLSGWTADSVILRQRFQQNGMLWADKIVSSTVTARLDGSPQSISATLVDSEDALLATVLASTPVNEGWNEFTGYGELPDTTNTDTPPAAYIDYRLALPSTIDIYLTSFQLVVQELPFEPSFEQDSIDRQIDHTYHTAYPIVPVGTVIEYGGFNTPAHYLLCDGTAYSRTAYNLLFQAITTTETVTLTSTVSTFTVTSSTKYRIGMPLEGTGIPAATTISGISGTIITMSAAATITGSSTIRFFAAPNGNGTTTFNIYDQRDYVVAGAGGSGIVTITNSGIGGVTGEATHAQTIDELAAHTHGPGAGNGFVNTGGASGAVNTGSLLASSAATASTGNGTPFNITQLTMFMNKCIRFE
jgi:tail collar domain